MNVGKNADGHRGAEGREAGVKKRGGKRPDRVKEDSVVDSWWHPDAKDALAAGLRLSERRCKAGKFIPILLCSLIYDLKQCLTLHLYYCSSPRSDYTRIWEFTGRRTGCFQRGGCRAKGWRG